MAPAGGHSPMSQLQAPAAGTVRLGARGPEGGVDPETVEVPGRPADCRGAVRGRDPLALIIDLLRLAVDTVLPGGLFEDRPIDYSHRFAFEHEIESFHLSGGLPLSRHGSLLGHPSCRSASPCH